MSNPEGFLTRWARRKQNAANKGDSGVELERDETAAPMLGERTEGEDKDDKDNKATSRVAAVPKGDPTAPAFDLSKLPPIEAITATTDIRPFLVPGVPAELTRAALRRAWVADPAIRDYIGLSENSWDFTAPGVPGFDLSPPTGDLKRMLADIMGSQPDEQAEQPTPESKSDSAVTADHPPSLQDEPVCPARVELTSHSIVKPESDTRTEPEPKSVSDQMIMAEHKKNDAAPQQNKITSEGELHVAKRNHGGALPK
jgi:hypothetical protein